MLRSRSDGDFPAKNERTDDTERKSFYIADGRSGVCPDADAFNMAGNIRLAVLGQRPSLPRFVARNRANVAIYAFDRREMDAPSFAEQQIAIISADRAITRIFLQLASPEVHGPAPIEIDEKNRTIETMARRCGAHLVAMTDLYAHRPRAPPQKIR